MKNKIWVISVLLFTFCACSTSITEDVENGYISGTYVEQIKVLNDKYSDKTGSELSAFFAKARSADAEEIAKADVEGGLAVGEAVLHITKNGKAALVAFAVAGAFCSYAEYVGQQDSTTAIISRKGDNLAVDLRNPIGDNKPNMRTLLPNAIGSEIGMYHNYVIAELLTDSICSQQSGEWEVFSAFCSMLENAEVYTADELEDMKQVVSSNNLLDTWREHSTSFADSQESILVSEFLSNISEIKESLRYEYVCSYMQIIESAYLSNELSEETASFVNAAVSVWYYSHNLWKYYIPLDGCASAYIVETTAGSWYLTTSFDKMCALCEAYGVGIIGIPQISNGQVTEIFFFEDMDRFLQKETKIVYSMVEDDIIISTVATDMDINIDALLGEHILCDVADRTDVHYVSL